MTSLRETKKRSAKRRLLGSAIKLFRAHGVDQVTVEQITAAAETAKGTFFNYFPTKDHVLVEYYDELVTRAVADAEARPSPSPEVRVTQLLCACARVVRPNRELTRALLQALFTSELVAVADRAHEGHLHLLLRAALAEGIARREFRDDLEVDVFASLLTAALSGTIQDWVRDRSSVDPERILKKRLKVLFRAAHRARGPARRQTAGRPRTPSMAI